MFSFVIHISGFLQVKIETNWKDQDAQEGGELDFSKN
jgi:hypothetical protein